MPVNNKIHNQTIHDDDTTKNTYSAILKLASRYDLDFTIAGKLNKIFFNNFIVKLDRNVLERKSTIFNNAKLFKKFSNLNSLQEVIKFLDNKMLELLQKGKISQQAKKVIEANFQNLLSMNMEDRVKAFNYLKLAIYALEDRLMAKKMLSNHSEENINQYIIDRWVTWFDNAIIDSQLAYWRDRGQQGWPSDEQLSENTSCFGGSLFRIIFALNLIHPDVTIAEGQQTLNNIVLYKNKANLAVINDFCSKHFLNKAKEYLNTIPIDQLIDILKYLTQGNIDQANNLINPIISDFQKYISAQCESYIVDQYGSGRLKEITSDLVHKTLKDNFIKPYKEYHLEEHIQEIVNAGQEFHNDIELIYLNTPSSSSYNR